MEWAKTNAHRGFITSWPQWGGPAGLFVANIIVMVGIGLWIRLGILETPVFQRILEQQQVARAPVVEVIRRQPREII